MKPRTLSSSFSSAFAGMLYVFRTQRNMRVHVVIALAVTVLALLLKISLPELALLTGTIGLVLLAEVINTSVEILVDLATAEYHPLAQRAKDVTAGAVLLSSIVAIIVGFFLFVSRLTAPVERGMNWLTVMPWQISLLSVLVVGGAVVLLKALFRRGAPFRGGMPSGHSAVAFSIWILVSLMSGKAEIMILVFPLAVMIAIERVVRGMHNVWEVCAGALLGISVSLLLIQLTRLWL